MAPQLRPASAFTWHGRQGAGILHLAATVFAVGDNSSPRARSSTAAVDNFVRNRGRGIGKPHAH